MRVRVAVAGDGGSVAGVVTESVHRGLGHEMETGVKTICHGLLVEPSWLPLVICVLRSRPCNVGSSRLRKKTILNEWIGKS